MPTKLDAKKEAEFQKWAKALPWYAEFKTKHGGYPNLDDPQYDYRLAWSQGISPQKYEHDGGAYHWPSVAPGGQALKSKDHPTAWMEEYMQEMGIDPNEVGASKSDWDFYKAAQENKAELWRRARLLQMTRRNTR